MKAAELRIGNLVLIENNVLQILCGEQIDLDSDIFEPILLTEEWILKFGFYQDIEDDRYLEFKIENDKWNRTLTVQKGEKEFMVSNRFDEWIICGECEFVHQLQNLYFALTQTELELR